MSAALKLPPARMTVAEFLAWDSGDRSGAPWQLVDGEPTAMAPASLAHGSIQSELGYLLVAHLRARGSPCGVVTTPGVVPRINANGNLRIPDLGVTCSPSREGLALADPVVLIEIMSPNNVAETRGSIWSYTTIPSVREILVVHSTRVEVELLRRGADGGWPKDPDVIGPEGVIVLESIGFSAALTDVYVSSGLL